MRVTGIVAAVVAVLLVVGLLGLELAATSLATRSARTAVERCVEVEDLEVTALGRPAVVGLIRGEIRDVRITARGLTAGDLRLERVDARLPVAPTREGAGPETLTVVADVTIADDDLEHYLAVRAPELAAPTLRILPGELEIGDERVPFTLGAEVGIDAEGDLRLVPTLGDPRLWSSLGLELTFGMPRDVELLAIDLHDGEVVVSARVQVHAQADGGPTCPDIALLGVASLSDGMLGAR